MPQDKKTIFLLGLAILIFLLFKNFVMVSVIPSWKEGDTKQSKPPSPSSPSKPLSSFIVIHVVDGDTIQIDTGQKVRYIGMNTPETVDPRRPVQCFGKEASVYNKNLVLNKKVKLVKDISEKDKYGRLLRYVYLADGTFVNLKLVRDGYAYADTFPPDVAHAADFVTAQQQAREGGLGLWGKCK